MKKIILEICPNTKHSVNGIGTYCNALSNLFQGDEDVEVLPPPHIPAKELSMLNLYAKWSDVFHAINESGADVIHINGYTSFLSSQALIVSLILHKKIVYTAHWHPFSMLRRPFFGRIFFYVCFRPFLSFLDLITAINSEDTQYFQNMNLPVVRIPHWSHFEKLSSLQPVQKKSNMILFIGRFNANNKGMDYLYSLPEGLYDIHCVGRGTAEQRSDMTFHTDIPLQELCQLYAQASLVVIPSKYEAFSYVALEAFFFGTPVVMSDRVRIADYLMDVSGYNIFPYGDKSAFVSAVSNTIGTQVNRDKILSIFNPQNIKKQYKSLFLEL